MKYPFLIVLAGVFSLYASASIHETNCNLYVNDSSIMSGFENLGDATLSTMNGVPVEGGTSYSFAGGAAGVGVYGELIHDGDQWGGSFNYSSPQTVQTNVMVDSARYINSMGVRTYYIDGSYPPDESIDAAWVCRD